MTASTITSKSSRMIEAPVEGASSRDAAAGRVGTAIWVELVDELSAHPFQLLATGVANFEAAAVDGALHSHGQSKAALDVGGQRPDLRALGAPSAPRPVG